MEITCDIAMDLVDIYVSGGASEDTKESVREHLKTCRECRCFYDEYRKSIINERKEKRNKVIKLETSPCLSEELLSESARKLSKRLRRRRIIIDVVSIISVLVGVASLLWDIFGSSDDNGK